jgi:MoaA/NifB/PqqE/SkfB family radical SAM enzyme
MLVRSYSTSRLYRRVLAPVLSRLLWRSLFDVDATARRAMLRVGLGRALRCLPMWIKRLRLGVRLPVTLSVVDDIGCKAGCDHCVFNAFSVRGPGLALADLDRLFDQALGLNVTTVYLIGADPFYRDNADAYLDLLASKRWQTFMLFTEGRRLDDRHVERIRRAGNIVPVLNIDGLQAQSDRRKGAGAFADVQALMDKLRARRMPFLVTTMVSRANRDEVTSVEYARWLEDHGAWMLAYVPYTPVDRKAEAGLELDSSDRERLFARATELNSEVKRLVVLDLLGIEQHLTSCPAGVYGVTVYHDGTVTPCPAAQFGRRDANVLTRSLEDIFVHDPLYVAMRSLHGRAKPVHCLFYTNPEFFRAYLHDHHAEMRVLNPAVLAHLGVEEPAPPERPARLDVRP